MTPITAVQPSVSRRRFLQRSAVVGGSMLLLPSANLASAAQANDKLNIAGIGVGGQGRGNLDNLSRLGHNIVALCDVDQVRAADTFKRYPKAKVYGDYRRLLDDAGKGIDAVVVSTPDHTHAVAAVAAMRLGKHVYCEKPLTRTVREARVMRETAERTGVVTQMGNQGSAAGNLRRAVELARGGVLGEIREAHVWFDGGNGPLKRPEDTPAIPETLDWNLWLGPAPKRPYHPAYLPGSWRGWRAFGSGIVGDFGCHTGNIMFRALRLDQLWRPRPAGAPDRTIIRVESFPSEVDVEGYPASSRTVYQAPARGELPAVEIGVYAKERPSADLMLGFPQAGWGDLLVGSKGTLYSECPWNTHFVLLPEKRFDGFKGGPAPSLPRTDNHHREWADACRGRGTTFSSFAIGGPLTEFMQLGNVAAQVAGPLDYDTISGRILNNDQADALLHREYRNGWSI